MSKTITSAQNQRLKELRKLHDRRQRERSGLFMAEGEDMLMEASRHGAHPEAVFYDAAALDEGDALLAELPRTVELMPVRGEALASAGSLGSGSRVIGVWKQRWAKLTPPRHEPEGRLADERSCSAVYLHEVADPGNVGTVLRSALAFGPSVVTLSPRTADPFGPKAVRASMGAVFGQAVARSSFDEARAALGSECRAIALVPWQGRPLRELDLRAPSLFALGSERCGLPDRIVAACDEIAHVPLRAEGAESLNVAMAATVCLYESAVHRLQTSNLRD